MPRLVQKNICRPTANLVLGTSGNAAVPLLWLGYRWTEQTVRGGIRIIRPNIMWSSHMCCQGGIMAFTDQNIAHSMIPSFGQNVHWSPVHIVKLSKKSSRISLLRVFLFWIIDVMCSQHLSALPRFFFFFVSCIQNKCTLLKSPRRNNRLACSCHDIWPYLWHHTRAVFKVRVSKSQI